MSRIHLAKIGREDANASGYTRKDWIGETNGKVFKATWGRIGKTPQSKQWDYPTEEECEIDFRKTVASKIKGGYKEFKYSLSQDDFDKLQDILERETARFPRHTSSREFSDYSDLREAIEDLNLNTNSVNLITIPNCVQPEKKISFTHNLALHGIQNGNYYKIVLEKA